jgi:hypothetical protein
MSKERQFHGVKSLFEQPANHPAGNAARAAGIGFDPLRIADQ